MKFTIKNVGEIDNFEVDITNTKVTEISSVHYEYIHRILFSIFLIMKRETIMIEKFLSKNVDELLERISRFFHNYYQYKIYKNKSHDEVQDEVKKYFKGYKSTIAGFNEVISKLNTDYPDFIKYNTDNSILHRIERLVSFKFTSQMKAQFINDRIVKSLLPGDIGEDSEIVLSHFTENPNINVFKMTKDCVETSYLFIQSDYIIYTGNIDGKIACIKSIDHDKLAECITKQPNMISPPELDPNHTKREFLYNQLVSYIGKPSLSFGKIVFGDKIHKPINLLPRRKYILSILMITLHFQKEDDVIIIEDFVHGATEKEIELLNLLIDFYLSIGVYVIVNK